MLSIILVSPSDVGDRNFPVWSYQQGVERNDGAGLDLWFFLALKLHDCVTCSINRPCINMVRNLKSCLLLFICFGKQPFIKWLELVFHP